MLCLTLSSSALLMPSAFADESWERIGEENGLLLFKKDVPGSSAVAFRGEGIVEAPILRVASILLNHEKAPEWVERLAEIRTLKRLSASDLIEYSHIETPIVLKDRDFLCKVHLELQADKKTFVIHSSSTQEYSFENKKYVRAQLLYSTFTLTSTDGGRKTHLTAELHADPKGSVPKWIVNFFQKSWPRKAFEGVRKQAENPKFPVPVEFKEVLQKLASWN